MRPALRTEAKRRATNNQVVVQPPATGGGALEVPVTAPTPKSFAAGPVLDTSGATSFFLHSGDPGFSNDGAPYTLGLRFTSSQAGYVHRVLFHKSAQNTGTHIGTLWRNGDQAKLGQVTFSGETATGWQAADFSPPIAISAGVEYTVAYTTTAGFYAATPNDASGLSKPPLSTPNPAGYFLDGATPGFPASTFSNNNYWVDVGWKADSSPLPPYVQPPLPPQLDPGTQPAFPIVAPKAGLVASAVPQPSGAGQVVGFAVQNSGGSAAAAQYVRLHQTFAPGAIPSGQYVAATLNGSSVPIQADVKTRWSDGSIKGAVLTISVGSVPANTTWTGMLSATTTAPGTALGAGAAVAAGYNLVVTAVIGGTTYTVTGATLLSAQSGNIWRQGALAMERRVQQAITSSLRVILDVTAYSDGSTATNVIFANDGAMGAAGGTITYGSIAISQGGTTRFSRGALTQYQYSVWQQAVFNGATSTPTLNVLHDVNYLATLGVVPNYDLYDGTYTPLSPGAGWTNILGVQGVTQYMPQTGGRDDIGTVTAGNARWLISQTPTAADYAQQQAVAAGSVPWNFWDTAHGRWLSLDDYPQMWIDARGTQQPTQYTADPNWTPETAHQPDLAFVPFVKTGDRYWLDRVNAQAAWTLAQTWPGPRGGGGGIIANVEEQLRAQAWGLRQLENAALANPDGSYEQEYFRRMADNNWTSLLGRSQQMTNDQGEPYGWIRATNRIATATATWQNNYFASVAALASLRGVATARKFMLWTANFLSGAFLNSAVFSPAYGYAYELDTATTWADMQTLMGGSITLDPAVGVASSGGDYAQLALMANGCLFTVFASGTNTIAHYYAIEAARAYGWLLWSREPLLRDEVQFEIMPRLPDGRLLTAAECQIPNGSSNVTVSTTNGFVYYWGNDPVTLTAGAGSAVLIDASDTAGVTLVGGASADYLIGGRGSNRFRPGAGYNVVRACDGVATVEADPAVVSTIEIHAFKVASDKVDLTGTANGTGSTVLAGAVVSGGNTTLTVGSTTVILVGVTGGLTGGTFI